MPDLIPAFAGMTGIQVVLVLKLNIFNMKQLLCHDRKIASI